MMRLLLRRRVNENKLRHNVKNGILRHGVICELRLHRSQRAPARPSRALTRSNRIAPSPP
ncbi:hypothetical protein EPIB2_1131 [Tritonibacter mobilis]|nr:hypothetical protein EPIB2_1131 [Tritonibacter mobilis]